MDIMTAYCQDLGNEELLELAAKNLVTSQMRVVDAEVARRGLA